MCTKFGTAVGVADVITCDKFFGDRLRGVDSVGGQNCHLPLTKPVAVKTGLALQHSCDVGYIYKFVQTHGKSVTLLNLPLHRYVSYTNYNQVLSLGLISQDSG